MMTSNKLILRQVSVYAEGRAEPLLHDIHLTIEQGEWVSIIGPNGSGKSTLAKVLSGVITPGSGEVFRGFSGDGPIPYVMQSDEGHFGQTPWEDVVFVLEASGADPDQLSGITVKVLEQVGLAEVMHQPISTLSGGQRQKVAIAGCLAVDAPILLFDEATAMLDALSRRQVLALAKRLHRSGVTIVWLTHLMDEVAEGDRVVVLQDGKMNFDGDTVTFFYREDGTGSGKTPCEKAGYTAPYTVQVARVYRREGGALSFLPLNAEQLVKAVKGDG